MKVDKMDGFCVGEPWNLRSIADNIGYTVITTQKMWPDHPEKVCAFTEEFAMKNPRTVTAVLKALHLSSEYIDKMENRPHVAEVISQPTYINCPKEIILDRLQGKYDYGDGRPKEQDPNYMIFNQRNCNFPSRTYGYWWMSQFRRWGMVKGAPQYKQVSERVLRTDLYSSAMKEMGVKVTAQDLQPTKFIDHTFDPKDAEKYATSFPIHSMQS
jgi:nitrate/nitrite transport system substrate-binding protein